MHAIDRVLAYVVGVPWAIHPDRGQAILDALISRAADGPLSEDQVAVIVGGDVAETAARREAAAAGGGYAGSGAIAVIPLYGTILHRGYQVERMSGGGRTSAERLAQTIQKADADPNIGTIVLDVDSPGGEISGIPEVAEVVARTAKPIVAVANAWAASAAYWIASQADELVVTPSGEVGSIGVWTMHVDRSKALEQEGIRPTLIRSVRYKAEGDPFNPLSDETRAELQRRVDTSHDTFVRAVARGRGVSVKTVRTNFGEGRVFMASDALERGMVDRIATLDETLARLSAGGRVKKRDRAELEPDAPAAADEVAPKSVAELSRRERELDLL